MPNVAVRPSPHFDSAVRESLASRQQRPSPKNSIVVVTPPPGAASSTGDPRPWWTDVSAPYSASQSASQGPPLGDESFCAAAVQRPPHARAGPICPLEVGIHSSVFQVREGNLYRVQGESRACALASAGGACIVSVVCA